MLDREISASLKRLIKHGLVEWTDLSHPIDGPLMKLRIEENKE
jgi:hypothetical protein